MNHIVLVCGYFDWFSGYQEIGLARSLAKQVKVTVVAGDRANPGFTDAHLRRIGAPRTYSTGASFERGVNLVRLGTREIRSMLWSNKVGRTIAGISPDAIIQVMPGQLFPALATTAAKGTPRAVLYGDNSAMWAGLSPVQTRIKWLVFAGSKGILYKSVNKRAKVLYGYTPETVSRLRKFSAGRDMQVLPLSYTPEQFSHSIETRNSGRRRLGVADEEVLVMVAGKLQPQKRLDLVAGGVSTARDRGIRARLLIVGNDDSAKSRALVADALESASLAPEAVLQVGFLDSQGLNEMMNAADLGVWPTMPAITIQQAMGTGLDVVLPDNAYVSHLLTSASGTYLHSEKNIVDSIAASIPCLPESTESRTERAKGNEWLSSDALASRILGDLERKA